MTNQKSVNMSGTNSESGIDVALLEKRLEGLRDTQESVQGLSIWCQANKKFSTSIIETWLRCLKRSPVEKRLTLFYLANDVVQHARRKGDGTLINQWAVAVQKATPHVRSPSSISSAISRIFKIWEERSIYSKDAVADLLSLLNSSSGKEKSEKKACNKKPETYTASAEKVSSFQSSTMVTKVKLAFRLKSHLGVTFRTKHYVNMNMEQLIGSIKDRQHGMEVIQEMAQLLEECRTSEHKLLNEVEERRKIVETAEIGIVSYENIRGEAGIVNTAYKNFTQRVESTKEKIDEKIRAFQEMESPEPSFPGPDFINSSSTNHERLSNINSNYIPIEVIQSTNLDTLKSINLPQKLPNKPVEPQPQYSDYSTMDSTGGTAEPYQQTTYSSQVASSVPGYDITMPNWTNETYNSMMTSMMNMQYQSAQAPQQAAPSVAPSNISSVFTLTPSMQLQMQMQQQHVAALQQQYHSPQSYNTSNTSYHLTQPPKVGGGDIGSIPLPPPSDNPPLPPEPNQNLTTVNSVPESYRPPLPNQCVTSATDHQQLGSPFDTSPRKSPASYTPQSRYHPYSSQDQSNSYPRSNISNSGDSSQTPQLTSNLAYNSVPTPRTSQFENPSSRFRPRNPNIDNNGYYNNQRFRSPSAQNLSPVNETPSNSSLLNNAEGDTSQLTSNQDYSNFESFDFDNTEEMNSSFNGDKSTPVGNNSFNNQSFYDRRFTSPQKSPRMSWSGGRARPNLYDGRGFGRGGQGRRGRGFDRGGRRGGY